MTAEELEEKLNDAEEQYKNSKYQEAEHLCKEVLTLTETPLATLYDRGELSEISLHSSEVVSLSDRVSSEKEEQQQKDFLRVRTLRLLGVVSFRRSNYPAALEHFSSALNISEDYNDREGIGKALNSIGLVHSSLSDYALALEYYGKALALAEEFGNKAHVAACLGNIGIVYKNLSEYPLTLDYFGKALALSEELGNKEGVANWLGNIGIVHFSLSEYSLALDYYGKALALDQELGNKVGVATRLVNIGNVYYSLLNYPLALEYYGKAVALYEELGIKAGVAGCLCNIGNVNKYLSEYPLALEYYGKALALDKELGNKMGVATHLGNIGVSYADPEFDGYDPDKAEEFLLKASAMNEELGTKGQNVSVLKSLSELYAISERWKESHEYFVKYHELEKEVQSEESHKQAQLMEHRRKIEEAERDRQVKLARFQEQEKILHNILPAHIADRMLDGEKTIADSHEHVSVFFSDIVGFTKLSQRVSAEELVGMLNGIFTQFDQLARKHGLEKIKTIGDAYMAVCGAPIQVDNHAERTALFALDVVELMNNYQTNTGDKVMIRIGLHSGSVVAGIIGENKFAYDMWGDAVNTASRMESHGEAGKIHVSEEFKHAVETLHATSLQFIRRGEMDIKGKGIMTTYFLERNTIH